MLTDSEFFLQDLNPEIPELAGDKEVLLDKEKLQRDRFEKSSRKSK